MKYMFGDGNSMNVTDLIKEFKNLNRDDKYMLYKVVGDILFPEAKCNLGDYNIICVKSVSATL